MRAWSVVGICVFGVAACGGSSSSGGGGSSTVTGTAGGQSIPTTDSVGLVGSKTQTVGGQTVTVAYAGVIITNKANTCSLAQGHHNPPNTTALSITVAAAGSSILPGTYAVGTGTTRVDFSSTTATCASDKSEQGTSGSIKFTTVSSTTVQGTFDVTMNNGDRLSGSFTAPVCNYDPNSSGPTLACGS